MTDPTPTNPTGTPPPEHSESSVPPAAPAWLADLLGRIEQVIDTQRSIRAELEMIRHEQQRLGQVHTLEMAQIKARLERLESGEPAPPNGEAAE